LEQPKNWKKIAERLKDRTDVQCLHRWQKVLNPEMKKGPWTEEEDRILITMSTMPRIGPKSPSFSKAESANSVASGK
jgi:hypothetical protein